MNKCGASFDRLQRDRARDLRKFALSSNAYKRYKLAQAIRHVALAGYTGVEVTADAPHAYPPALTKDDRKSIHSTLAQNRLAVSNLDASPMTALRDEMRPSWIEADRVLRQERIQHTLDAGQLGKEIGAPTISILAGGELDEEMSRGTAIGLFAQGLKHVAALAAKGKCLPVLIDPREGLLVATAAQALEVLEQVNSPHIGVNLNTGHLHRAGADIPAAIRQLKKFVRHVQIEDVAADGSGEVVVPGTGALDFAAVFEALDEIGYDDWLTVDLSGADVHPDDAARQALKFLGQFDK